jgi:hypothetical protein
MTEEDWAEIQRRAIREAEKAKVPLAEFLTGLQTMRIELQDRIEEVENEIDPRSQR